MNDLIVIGAGPGGYVAAIRAAQLGMSVLLIEKDQVGGTCLNRGCIPTKAYYENARVLRNVQQGQEFGIQVQGYSFDMKAAFQRKQQVVNQLVAGVERLLKANKVEVIRGQAHLKDSHTVWAGGQDYTAERILIATGSEPAALPIAGSDDPRVLTSDQALDLTEIPSRLAVIGGGVIGLEFACIFKTFGSQVTVFESQSSILHQLDREIVKRMQVFLKRQGINVYTSVEIERLENTGEGLTVQGLSPKGEVNVEADVILQAGGRRPCTQGLKLPDLGIETDQQGFIVVNDEYQTNVEGIYAIGDVIGGPMLAHVASEEGIAAVEHMAGHHPSSVQYHAVPSTIFTFPEIAAVGLTEEEAKNRGINPYIGKFSFAANGKAMAMGETDGIVKVIADENQHIIGMHIIGPHASDLILEGALAVSQKVTLPAMKDVIHAHPTLGEAIKEASLDAEGQAIHLAPSRK
jgi:dihydrolipoamide dehydrogenase